MLLILYETYHIDRAREQPPHGQGERIATADLVPVRKRASC